MFLFHRIIKSPLVTFFFGLSTFLISKNINFFYSLLMNLTYHFQRCKNLDPDNNVVENYFDHTKNNLKLRDLFPSEITSTLYERLQMKYFLYYNIEEKKSSEP